jgi:HK97 family phage prohead protease
VTEKELRAVRAALLERFAGGEDPEVVEEQRSLDAGLVERLMALLGEGDVITVDHEHGVVEKRSLTLAGDATHPTEPPSDPYPALADQPFRIRGHAAVFDQPSDVGDFFETIKPGAFRDVLASGSDVALLYTHDWNTILARTRSGSLSLTEDRYGLAFGAQLDPGDPDVQRLVPKPRRGDVNGMSFAFRAGRSAITKTRQGLLRTVLSVKTMGEVSVCARPAYPSTSCVLVRSAREILKEQDKAQLDHQRARLRLHDLAGQPTARRLRTQAEQANAEHDRWRRRIRIHELAASRPRCAAA